MQSNNNQVNNDIKNDYIPIKTGNSSKTAPYGGLDPVLVELSDALSSSAFLTRNLE